MAKNPKVNETQDFTDEEIARRRDDVIRRMGNTPPKPHSEMKIGKRKAKVSKKARSKKATADVGNLLCAKD